MKIEVWSDYVCPFCYIGKRRLEEALEQFPHRDQVEIIFKSFELDPNAPKQSDISEIEYLAQKYGMSIEQAKQMTNNVIEQAKTVGLLFQFDQMKHTNTFDAHRLAKFAETKGLGTKLTERLLRAHFIETKHLASHNVLLELACEAGLEKQDVEDILQSDKFASDVRADETEASMLRVQGVPFFVFNRKYAISGAQPADVFLKTLEKVWEEEKDQPLQMISEGMSCTDEGCK